MFLNYIILQFIRLGSLLLFWPILSQLGYGLTIKEVILCAYAGLRAAVGLTLALIVANSSKVDNYVQDVIIFHVGGIATLTLLINATTTKYLVGYLGLAKHSYLQKNIMLEITRSLDKNVDENVSEMKR